MQYKEYPQETQKATWDILKYLSSKITLANKIKTPVRKER